MTGPPVKEDVKAHHDTEYQETLARIEAMKSNRKKPTANIAESVVIPPSSPDPQKVERELAKIFVTGGVGAARREAELLALGDPKERDLEEKPRS